MDKNSGAATIAASLIVGIALIASSVLIKSSLDATVAELAGVRDALETAAVRPDPARPPQRPTAARPGRPDPTQRYSIEVDGAPSWGPEDAKITIVEFSDFQCPFCRRVLPTLQRLREEYPDDLRVVFKHLPLRIHPQAQGAHAAAQAAHRQGKFWEMHDKIFENPELTNERYIQHATELGLDVAQFEKDLASADVKQTVDSDSQEAAKLGVTGTPGFFINGRFLSGAQPYPSFQAIVEDELKKG